MLDKRSCSCKEGSLYISYAFWHTVSLLIPGFKEILEKLQIGKASDAHDDHDDHAGHEDHRRKRAAGGPRSRREEGHEDHLLDEAEGHDDHDHDDHDDHDHEDHGDHGDHDEEDHDVTKKVRFVHRKRMMGQASTLTRNGTGPIGPVTPRIYWFCKNFTNPTIFSLSLKEKTLHKIHRQHLFLFILSSFISKTFGIFLRGNLLVRMPLNVYWPCRRSLFYWPEAVFGNFYWPRAIGSLLTFSPVGDWVINFSILEPISLDAFISKKNTH